MVKDNQDGIVEMLSLPKEKGSAAFYCQCKVGCDHFLWPGSLTVRTRSGKLLSIGHALRDKFATRGELDQLHQETFPQYFQPEPPPEPEEPEPKDQEPEPEEPQPDPISPEPEPNVSASPGGIIQEPKTRKRSAGVLSFFIPPEGEEDDELREILDLLRD